MTSGAASKKKQRGRMRIALAAIAIFVLVLVVPPFISVSRYKGRITQIIAQSLGRPVRLSSVEVRLLPWPGFVLYDLSVAEDPAYGAEPVLHANKVTASLRLLSLWRGRLEIDKISVNEASLNLVRVAPGQWNLDPVFRTAAAQTGASGKAGPRVRPLPSLEATESRINFKNGVEKLPFSLVNADLSFWEAGPGEWRIRLRGQPARTDVSLDQEETGIVGMEASVRSAPALAQMPLHLYLNWREAQLGQLARIITGSDPGWRGDLTGELHVDGTADAAQIAVRLRASSVHRAEFAPAAPLDFDANCAFVYQYTRRSLENLVCDSPLGDGRIRLTGTRLGFSAPPDVTLELDRIPVAAGLDLLRTLRSGLDPSLEAGGTVSGKIVYASALAAQTDKPANQPGKIANAPSKSRRATKAGTEPAGPLSGILTVTDFALTGGGLSQPVQAPRIAFVPSAAPRASADALTGTVAVPAGGNIPLVFNLRLTPAGYQVGVRGQAAITRARELAHVAGIAPSQALAALAGEPLGVDLTAAGSWLPPEENLFVIALGVEPASLAAQESPASGPLSGDAAVPFPAPSGIDSLTGTVTLHNANWKAGYLAGHIQIAEATLHVDGSSLRWDPLDFSFGPLKGTATLSVPVSCPADAPGQAPCPVQVQVQFADLDASLLQSTLLGAREKSNLLTDLIDRLRPSTAPPWPPLEGSVKVDSLILGPVTLHGVSAALRVLPTGVQVVSLDGELLGGSVHVAGSLAKPATGHDKPTYIFMGDFQKLDAASVGALLGLRWSGKPLNGNGKIELSGYTAKDLAASAHGMLHFECRRGAIGIQRSESSRAERIPAALGRFDNWTADATIAKGGLTLDENLVTAGLHKQSVAATVTFGDPPVVSFAAPKPVSAKH